jgi:tripartite-type tricarboxylate transporter receptor subunit TctC
VNWVEENTMRFCASTILAAGLLITIGAGAQAQQPYPTRPITVVVPFAAGGPTDVLARILGQHMSQTLGQQIVVENITGGGGSIGAARVAKAAPDGYTMVMGNLATDTLKDFIAYAVANPHKLTFGSAGTGSISHLTYLLFTHLTRTEIEHVPYRGLSQSVNDLLSGQIDMMFDQVVSATPHILSGGVKPIAVTASTRAAAIPNVPSSTEAGLPELQTIAWTALFSPKAEPKPITARVNAALDQAMRDETVAKRWAELGADLPAEAERKPQALGKLVRTEIDKWVPLIQAAGVVGN